MFRKDISVFRKIAVSLPILLLSSLANAGIITEYSDRTAFDVAVGATTLEDFLPQEHFPITSGVLNDQTNEAGILPGDIQSGVTYSTPIGTGNFFNIDFGGDFTGGMLDRVGNDGDLTITFDNPVAAFGFDTNELMGTEFTVTINFTSNPPYTDTYLVVQSRDMQFFGFQSSSTDVESVVIRSTDGIFAFIIDNFAFGGAPTADLAPVPTLSQWAMITLSMLLGLVAFTGRRRLF